MSILFENSYFDNESFDEVVVLWHFTISNSSYHNKWQINYLKIGYENIYFEPFTDEN